jgi:hypothetical protein
MRPSRLLVCACVMVANALVACAQTPPPPPPRTAPPFDPALVREQQRRVAAFDSVVRIVNTDSLYRLWQAMLTAPDIRATQLLVDCELQRLSYRYGRAAYYATKRMNDTLWKRADPAAVRRMDGRMVGGSPPISRDTCGPRPPVRAPRWLRQWTVYALPDLPPSPDDTTTADPSGA